jgi:hypothetical protein
MTCRTHGTTCAYPNPDTGQICDWCHCSWERITAPATETVWERPEGKAKGGAKGELVARTRYLFGRGELPLEHIARHVTADRADITAAAERARKRGAA